MVTRTAIVAKARELVEARVPWHHGQASRHGCDCIGLIRLIATELDLFDGTAANPEIKRFLGYGTEPRPDWMRAALTYFMVRVPDTEPLPPATVLWLKVDVGAPRHLAIVTDRDGVIHCRRDIGRVVEHGISAEWRRKNATVAAWDFPGVEG